MQYSKRELTNCVSCVSGGVTNEERRSRVQENETKRTNRQAGSVIFLAPCGAREEMPVSFPNYVERRDEKPIRGTSDPEI